MTELLPFNFPGLHIATFCEKVYKRKGKHVKIFCDFNSVTSTIAQTRLRTGEEGNPLHQKEKLMVG